MSDLILNQEVLCGQWRFTSQTNQIQEAAVTDELEASVLKDTTKIWKPGLKGWGLSGEGFWIGGDDAIDDVLFDQQRTENLLVTLAAEDGSVGSPARTVQAMIGEYAFGAAHGELVDVSYRFAAMSRPFRSLLLHNGSATGNVTGTAVQIGSVSATQFVYAGLHVFSGTGNFTVVIESDDDSGFASPTTQHTFTLVGTATPATYEYMSPVAGAITDDWWRITATNPATRNFAVAVGIAEA